MAGVFAFSRQASNSGSKTAHYASLSIAPPQLRAKNPCCATWFKLRRSLVRAASARSPSPPSHDGPPRRWSVLAQRSLRPTCSWDRACIRRTGKEMPFGLVACSHLPTMCPSKRGGGLHAGTERPVPRSLIVPNRDQSLAARLRPRQTAFVAGLSAIRACHLIKYDVPTTHSRCHVVPLHWLVLK